MMTGLLHYCCKILPPQHQGFMSRGGYIYRAFIRFVDKVVSHNLQAVCKNHAVRSQFQGEVKKTIDREEEELMDMTDAETWFDVLKY